MMFCLTLLAPIGAGCVFFSIFTRHLYMTVFSVGRVTALKRGGSCRLIL